MGTASGDRPGTCSATARLWYHAKMSDRAGSPRTNCATSTTTSSGTARARRSPGFGITEEGRIAALAVVTDRGDPVWEVGMDVIPEAKGRGLGRIVVAAAANWILENDGFVMAMVGPFNVPSVRTLRASGLHYAFTTLEAMEGQFRIPPQPLGTPLPDAEVFDYYPHWAMNQKIKPRP